MNLSRIRIGIIKKAIDINEKFFFERKMKHFYKQAGNINTVIDVGANKGQSIDFFLKINPRCRIYAIEPNPDLYRLLLNKYQGFENVSIFNFGISDKSGEKLFFENVFDYSSTFEEINPDSEFLNKKAKILGFDKDSLVKKSYPVNAITLSGFIKEHDLQGKIDILKIDTEGHEYYCLLGLFIDNTKPGIRFIQLENHNDDMYANRIKFSDINDLLNINNFRISKTIKHGFGNFDEVIFTSI